MPGQVVAGPGQSGPLGQHRFRLRLKLCNPLGIGAVEAGVPAGEEEKCRDIPTSSRRTDTACSVRRVQPTYVSMGNLYSGSCG